MFFYFVRHGLTENNIDDKFQGSHDRLTDHGRAQAQHVSKKLKLLPIEAIFASDYSRARESAEIIAHEFGKEVILSPYLREVSRPTELHGVARSEPRSQEFFAGLNSNMHDPNWRWRDEESFNDTVARAKECESFLLTSKYEHNLVVTHGKFLRTFVCVLMFGDDFTPRLARHIDQFLNTKNTGITTLEYNNSKWRLLTWNDYAHLADLY